jgi:hypothetical protein
VVQANKRTLAEQEANRYLAEYVVEPVSDPIGELAALTGRVKAFTSYCESRFLESGDGEWLGLHARSMGELAKQLEVLSRLLPVHQAAKAEADEAQTKETVKQIMAALLSALDEVGVGLVDRQKLRLRHLIALSLDTPDVPALPDCPPGHGTSGRLPGFTVAVDLLKRLGRSKWVAADQQDDVETLRVACAAFLDTHGHPAEVTDEAALTGTQAALPCGVDDAVVVEDQR